MNPRITESLVQPFVQQFWQVSALVLIVAAIVATVGRRRPHLAYLLWLLVAAKCVTPPVVGSPTGVFSLLRSGSGTMVEIAGTDATESIPASPINHPSATIAAVREEAPLEPTAASPMVSITDSVALGRRWSWAGLLFAGWSVGACIYAIYLTAHWLRFQRIVADGRVPDDGVMHIYEQLLKQADFRKPPQLVEVNEPFGPAVVGCLNATIVLPSQVLNEATPSDLESILAHELAHVRRRDVWISWLQAAAGIVWWFHPLVWYANRQIVRWREASCDEEVIGRLGIRPRQYADALLRVLESRVQPFPAMQIGMAVGESTERRLVRLMQRPSYCRVTPNWCWLTALVASLVFLPGAAWSWQNANPVEGQTAQANNAPAQVVFAPVENETNEKVTGRLEVVGQPLEPANSVPHLTQTLTIRGTATGPDVAGAKIRLLRMKGDDVTGSAATEVDSEGRFVFEQTFRHDPATPLPQEKVILRGRTSNGLSIWKEWHVNARPNGLDLVEPPDSPFTYFAVDGQEYENFKAKKTVSVEFPFPNQSVTLTGVVRDHLGKPVANAAVTTVGIHNPPRAQLGMDPDGGNSVMAFFPVQGPVTRLRNGLELTAQTNAAGEWTLGRFAIGKNIDVTVSTSDHATTLSRIGTKPGAKPVSVQMPESTQCKLTILDELTGKPVPLAAVRSSQQLQTDPLRTVMASGTTNAQGQVVLNLPAGKSLINLGPGADNPLFSFPTKRVVSVNSGSRDLQLKMATGAELEFKVVDDETNEPIPNMAVRPSPVDSLSVTPDSHSAALAQRGITMLSCLPGTAKFSVPAAPIQGYEIANPIEKPITISPGRRMAYTFRLRRMKEYRLPIAEDNLADFPAKHQAAVGKLRDLGAVVATHGNPEEAHCEVYLSQFWKGEPSDLRWLAELDFFKALHCIAYPVPKAFHAKQKPEPPTVTDEWLTEIGKCAELSYLNITRSSITDRGLNGLARCSKLDSLTIEGSRIKGPGIATLKRIPLSYLHVGSDSFDFDRVDLTAHTALRMLNLKSTTGQGVVPPKGMPRLIHTQVSPANEQTFERLNEYPSLQYVLVEGPDVTDEVLRSAEVVQRIQLLSLEKTSVTDDGLAVLADTKMASVRLVGEQFTDGALQHLGAMQNLREVTLKDTSITDEGITRLKDEKPKLVVRH